MKSITNTRLMTLCLSMVFSASYAFAASNPIDSFLDELRPYGIGLSVLALLFLGYQKMFGEGKYVKQVLEGIGIYWGANIIIELVSNSFGA